ncbi:MAG TPA: ROK family transcriptional regulator, partial [Rhizobiaceae bacterium]|nr:ROK family transcriptional regulator [Rhizobiaceae bacterium]
MQKKSAAPHNFWTGSALIGAGPEHGAPDRKPRMPFMSRPDDLRRQNQRRILAALRQAGPLSRTELSTSTGLSASTVTLITAQLLERGALTEDIAVEGPSPLARRGRPKVSLALNAAAANVGVVLLTLNRISASVIDYSGRTLSEKVSRLDTHVTRKQQLRSAMTGLLHQAFAEAPGGAAQPIHVAVAVQGVTDAEGGRLLWSPVTPLTDLPVADWFREDFGVEVSVANDCNVLAGALRGDDPERFGDSFAAVLLSHGIGMGLYLKGGIFTGLKSSAAEFGHMCFELGGARCRCGRTGCIEAYAGDYAIWRAAKGADPQIVPDIDIDVETM